MLSPCQISARRLARIAAAIKASELPSATDRAWLAESLEQYFAAAGQGVSLETAFGLTPGPGGVTWWAAERRDRRDALLRGVHGYHFADLTAPEAARAIHAAWRRYSRRQLRIDLTRGECAAVARSLDADLFVLATLGGPPGADRVADILNGAEQPEDAEVFETV